MSCMHPLKSIVGNIMNSTAKKLIVGKFELRMFRLQLHVQRLSKHSSLSVNCKYICQAAHMHRLVRTFAHFRGKICLLGTWGGGGGAQFHLG